MHETRWRAALLVTTALLVVLVPASLDRGMLFLPLLASHCALFNIGALVWSLLTKSNRYPQT